MDSAHIDIHPITPASLLASLDKFLALVTKINERQSLRSFPESKDNDCDEETAVQLSLFLLQNLPPARHAALSYLAQVLSKQVWQYMQSKEEPRKNKEDGIVNHIESLLSTLVDSSPELWVPFVARWSVDQLGRWSVEWEGVILSRGDTTLEERVAGWLLCTPAHALANLTVSCVALDADNTVAALLDASIHSGPALDWLVAHVGCSFPATIVNRVISLGLRSFANSTTQNQASQQLSSVNIILNHLADGHFSEIQRGLQLVLETTFSGTSDKIIKAAVPYLLQLASTNRSRAVLSALVISLPDVFQKSDNLNILTGQLSWWIPQYFPSTSLLIDLLVQLLLDSDGSTTASVIGLIFQGSVPSSIQGINFPSQVLHSLLFELCGLVYVRCSHNNLKLHVPLLTGLGLNTKEDKITKMDSSGSGMSISDIIEWSVRTDSEITIRRLGQLLTYLIIHEGPEASSSILSYILSLEYSVNLCILFLLNCVMSSSVCQQAFHNKPFKVLSSVVTRSIESDLKPSQVLFVLEKISAMVKGTRNSKTSTNEALTNAVLLNIPRLAKLINVPVLSVSVLELVGIFSLDKPMSLSHVFALGHAVVFYFCNSLRNVDIEAKLKNAHLCNKILSQLSHSSLGHSLLVRILFEAAFRPEWAYLFGAEENAQFDSKECPEHLLKTNLQFDSWVKLPQSHNTIFHSGKIGRDRPSQKRKKIQLSQEDISLNCQLLLNLVGTCCRTQGAGQGTTTIALIMVEYISPDIMFNGFPWPEENIKFTFERDLAIKKTFDDYPIAWHFLELVSRNRPALCYCSVLVRALTAALTAFWNTYPGNCSTEHPLSLKATQRLLEVMVVGQFLPEVFSVLPQMVYCLAPHELVCILQDVWAYLRDHTPSPDRWVLVPSGLHERPRDPPDLRYTDRIRKLIQIHIKDLGHLMSIMLKHHS